MVEHRRELARQQDRHSHELHVEALQWLAQDDFFWREQTYSLLKNDG
jgi:hypothetical protein